MAGLGGIDLSDTGGRDARARDAPDRMKTEFFFEPSSL
jgi:hypothetical protein